MTKSLHLLGLWLVCRSRDWSTWSPRPCPALRCYDRGSSRCITAWDVRAMERLLSSISVDPNEDKDSDVDGLPSRSAKPSCRWSETSDVLRSSSCETSKPFNISSFLQQEVRTIREIRPPGNLGRTGVASRVSQPCDHVTRRSFATCLSTSWEMEGCGCSPGPSAGHPLSHQQSTAILTSRALYM